MLQRFFAALMRIITDTFFRRIDIVGAEHVPVDGPVIFAGNHPNALMDGWLLWAKCGRWPLRFMVSAKLWDYPLLGRILDAAGAVPVYRREDNDGQVDNSGAFKRLFEVIESGECIGIFPEGVSHTESQLVKLKTGTARIALSVAARGNVNVKIIPVGLNYLHRHRFRSQVLIEFGAPIDIGKEWQQQYTGDESTAVKKLTEYLAESIRAVTLNAPDWRTMNFVQTARRLYKPTTAKLTPSQYIELNRRFVAAYDESANDAEVRQFRDDVEDYQARLDVLGIKDFQLRKTISVGKAFRRLLWRAMTMMLLLPVAIPGAILHLPVGLIAATVGEHFSYERDDVATIKVFATLALLPLIYVGLAVVVWVAFGLWWAFAAVAFIIASFFVSVWLIEAQAYLLASMLSILRKTRLRAEIEDLRETRQRLVSTIRGMVDKSLSPDESRMFDESDFANPELQPPE